MQHTPKAAFSLETYRFEKVHIDLSQRPSKELEIGFTPSGKFFAENAIYELTFIFHAMGENEHVPFVTIECLGEFKFEEGLKFEEIPAYFYRNAIAILFPYIRAFISTVTLQANINPIVLPTMNLSDLESPLKERTVQI